MNTLLQYEQQFLKNTHRPNNQNKQAKQIFQVIEMILDQY